MIQHAPRTEPVDRKHVVLLEDFYVQTRYGEIMVPEGFIYDGASAPWFSVFLLRLGRHGPLMLGPSAAHDFLYRCKCLSREQADTVYYDMMLENGIRRYKCKFHYSVLRKVGGVAWNEQPLKFRLDPR